jgi:hypothetical protein
LKNATQEKMKESRAAPQEITITAQRGVDLRTTPIITPWSSAARRGTSGIQRSRVSPSVPLTT